MEKKYLFEYTSTKGIVLLILSGFVITMALTFAVVNSDLKNTKVLVVLILAAFPITVLSLKKLVIRKGEARLYDNRVHIVLEKKHFKIPFSQIKRYFLENFQTVKLVISTDTDTVSIPVHVQFTDFEPAVNFFDAFQNALEKYAEKHPSDITRAKHYFISKDAHKLVTLFFLMGVTVVVYAFIYGHMSVLKASILSAMLVALPLLHAKEKRKYDLQTPPKFYDYNESHAKAKRKTIAITLLSIALFVFLARALLIVAPKLNIDDHITRHYANDLSSMDTIFVDFANSLVNPYEAIDPKAYAYDEDHTYFALAIENDNEKAVETMLRHHKIDLQQPVYEERNPLLLALWHDNFKAAKVLIEHGAKLDTVITGGDDMETLYTNVSSTMYAMDMNDAFVWLIENYDINYKNKEFLKVNLENLDYKYRDFFVFKLEQQLKALPALDENERTLLQFTTVYLKADDQDLIIKKYISNQLGYIVKYDQIMIRNARLQSSNYIPKDEDEKILLDAYRSGNKDAALDLGWFYEDQKQYDKAVEWLQKAFVVSQDGVAEYSLAYMYREMLNDDANAIKYYQQAIMKNNYAAVEMFLTNYPEANQDMHNDISLVRYPRLQPLQKTALQNATDAITLGTHYASINIADYKRALYWYEKAVEIGTPENIQEAKAGMGAMYFKQKMYNKALNVFMNIPDYKYAKLNIAILYDHMKEYDHALEWHKKAWAEGYTDAGVHLGNIYYEHLKSYDKAVMWYKKAYAKGDIQAAYNLAGLYENRSKKDQAIALYLELYKYSDDESDQMEILHRISILYHEQNDEYRAAAYYIATIDKRYLKEDALKVLKNEWKIDEETLKKAYELQKTLVPDPFTGSID